MRESEYQRLLVKRLKTIFPGCVVLVNDPHRKQGVPDLTILYGDKWAALEVKISKDAPKQPNQEYYVELLNSLSFSAFIHPGNEEEVLRDLQSAFRSS